MFKLSKDKQLILFLRALRSSRSEQSDKQLCFLFSQTSLPHQQRILQSYFLYKLCLYFIIKVMLNCKLVGVNYSKNCLELLRWYGCICYHYLSLDKQFLKWILLLTCQICKFYWLRICISFPVSSPLPCSFRGDAHVVM